MQMCAIKIILQAVFQNLRKIGATAIFPTDAFSPGQQHFQSQGWEAAGQFALISAPECIHSLVGSKKIYVLVLIQ